MARLEEYTYHYINYNSSGNDNFSIFDTDRQAEKLADQNARFTERDITIEDENGDIIASRCWHSEPFDPTVYKNREQTDIIDFGARGHYGPWQKAAS